MSKITIEDISRHTGLSRGTVSRALNDRPDISEKTKQRVLAACTELRYVPSHAARSLATGRRYAVAIVVDDLRSTYASCFLRGALARAGSARYAVHVSELGPEGDEVLEHLAALINERVDCVLLPTPLRRDMADRIVDAAGERPVVSAVPLAKINCDIMAPDFAESGRLAARHVVNAGNRSVLYVHEIGSEAADLRRAGFQEVCQAAGIDPLGVTVDVMPPRTDGGDRLELVRARLDGLRAIVAGNDFLALELLLLCGRNGLVPGHDIAVVGQGNEIAGARIAPTLTTIDYCGEEIGGRAMDIALQRVSDTRRDTPRTTRVPPVLVARESSRLLQ